MNAPACLVNIAASVTPLTWWLRINVIAWLDITAITVNLNLKNVHRRPVTQAPVSNASTVMHASVPLALLDLIVIPTSTNVVPCRVLVLATRIHAHSTPTDTRVHAFQAGQV